MRAESKLRDVTLHAHIRRLIDEGRLPVLLPDMVSANYGSGSKCHGCDQPLIPTQIEYDVQERRNGTVQLSLHLECYVLWQVECVKRIRDRNRHSLLN